MSSLFSSHIAPLSNRKRHCWTIYFWMNGIPVLYGQHSILKEVKTMAKQKESNDLHLSDEECRKLYDKYVDGRHYEPKPFVLTDLSRMPDILANTTNKSE